MEWIPAILILPYFFLLINIYRNLSKIRSFNASNDPSIYVSVIVACRNEQDNLPVLLSFIEDQDYPVELFEVIIVDDNSTDNTFEIASGKTGQINIIAVKNNGDGKKQAIRTGISHSSGNLIITTDADCRMGSKWIRTVAAFYNNYKPDMIISPVKLVDHPGFFGRFQELEYMSLQGITAGSLLSGNETMCNGANLAFTKETYNNNVDNTHLEIASGDDIFLLHSLKKEANSNIAWLESEYAIVTTASSSSIGLYMKQRRRWISKVKSYDDGYTIILGIVTFIAITVQISVLAAAILNPYLIKIFITIFVLKSIPDFLILNNTCRRYGKKSLIRWFFPSQMVYPFYVLGVGIYSLISFLKQED